MPDLYVHRTGWGKPIAVALELKAKDGRPSEAQKWLADRNVTRIVRSSAEALSTLLNIELELGHRDQASRITEAMTINNWENQ